MPGILFLDVDGVLNGKDTGDQVEGCPGIEDRKVRLVRWILERTGARLVLTSSWKGQWLAYREGEKEPFGQRLSDALDACGIAVTGITSDEMDDRGAGIREYLRQAGEEDAPFAVLDDTEFSDFASLGILPHLVKTDYRKGLTFRDALRAVRILRRGRKGERIG